MMNKTYPDKPLTLKDLNEFEIVAVSKVSEVLKYSTHLNAILTFMDV